MSGYGFYGGYVEDLHVERGAPRRTSREESIEKDNFSMGFYVRGARGARVARCVVHVD
jgi:hypothetical protein